MAVVVTVMGTEETEGGERHRGREAPTRTKRQGGRRGRASREPRGDRERFTELTRGRRDPRGRAWRRGVPARGTAVAGSCVFGALNSVFPLFCFIDSHHKPGEHWWRQNETQRRSDFSNSPTSSPKEPGLTPPFTPFWAEREEEMEFEREFD